MSDDDPEAFMRRFAARLGLPSDARPEAFERVIAERLGISRWDQDWAFRWSMSRMSPTQREEIRVVQQDQPRPAAARSLGRPARPRPRPKGRP